MKWFFGTAHGVRSSPAIAGGAALFVDGVLGDQGRRLHAVDLDSGRLRWRHPVAADASGALTADADGVLVQARRTKLGCLDGDGSVRWTNELGRVEHAVAATSALVVIAVSAPPSLVTLDRPTGQVLWRVALEREPRASPVLANRAILLGTDRGVELRSLVDGQLAWRSPSECGGVAGPVAVDDERFYFVNDTGQFVVAGIANARVLATVLRPQSHGATRTRPQWAAAGERPGAILVYRPRAVAADAPPLDSRCDEPSDQSRGVTTGTRLCGDSRTWIGLL